MAFTGLNWQHVKTTLMDVDKMIGTMVTMITGPSSSRDGSSDSRTSASSGSSVAIPAENNRVLLLKRKSTDDESDSSENGESQAKKQNCKDSESDSENNGSIRFLSSLTSVITKPSSFLKKSSPLYSGTDHWVPQDLEEIAEFPTESLGKYKKVHPNVEAPKKFKLVNGEFSVLASAETLSRELATAPIKGHKHEQSREEKLTKNELQDNEEKKDSSSDDEKKEKVLYHLAITLYNEKSEKYVMSLFRSAKLSDAVALCERCRENPELFRVFPKNVNIKEYLHLIFNELRDNMTWKATHISAKIGLLEFFENLKPHKLEKHLNAIVQPEGMSPLMIAIQNDQIETVKWMLEHGADINCISTDGGNVLHVAATSSGEMIRLLWETKKCATMLNKSDTNGNSPTYMALSNACILNCQLLRSFGGTINASDTTHTATPVIGAMKRGKLDEASLKKILEVKSDGLAEKELTTENSVIHCATSKKALILLMEKFRDQTDPEARNAFGQTPLHVFVLKDEMGLAMTICAYRVEMDAQDINGNTPLHFACTTGNVEMARMLLCLGANPNVKNRYKETPRHLAARVADQETKMDLVRALIICGGVACDAGFVGCAFGCMHSDGIGACKTHIGNAVIAEVMKCDKEDVEKRVADIGVSKNAATAGYEFVLDPDTQMVEEAYAERNETRAFPHEQAMERVKSRLKELVEQKKTSNVINVLGLDGGGIRGLVTVQMLIAVEQYLDRPLLEYFDWIGATSTGCYIMSCLMTGGSLRHAQRYYLQFKDQLFDSWSRPYDTKTLEMFLKSAFGADRKLGDIKYPRFFCTTVRADTFPVQLDLFRNYQLPISAKENDDLGFGDPMELTMWQACRRSSAAPTYFSASEGKFIDGGMISNNPTLDLMSEICFYNTTCQKMKMPEKMVDVGCVLSVGTGVTPICPVDPSVFEMNDWMGLLRGIKNLSLVVIDQATATEGAPITRSRSWCHSLGIPYYRLNAPIFKDVILDTNDDFELAKIMWDSVVYSYTHKKDFQEVAELLKAVGTVDQRKELLKI